LEGGGGWLKQTCIADLNILIITSNILIYSHQADIQNNLRSMQ